MCDTVSTHGSSLTAQRAAVSLRASAVLPWRCRPAERPRSGTGLATGRPWECERCYAMPRCRGEKAERCRVCDLQMAEMMKALGGMQVRAAPVCKDLCPSIDTPLPWNSTHTYRRTFTKSAGTCVRWCAHTASRVSPRSLTGRMPVTSAPGLHWASGPFIAQES